MQLWPPLLIKTKQSWALPLWVVRRKLKVGDLKKCLIPRNYIIKPTRKAFSNAWAARAGSSTQTPLEAFFSQATYCTVVLASLSAPKTPRIDSQAFSTFFVWPITWSRVRYLTKIIGKTLFAYSALYYMFRMPWCNPSRFQCFNGGKKDWIYSS